MRERPSRSLRNKAQPLLPIEPIHLVDHAVNLIRQVWPLPANLGIVRQHRLYAVRDLQERRDRKPPCLDLPHHIMLRVGGHIARCAPAIGPEAQGPLGGDTRILLPQRSCGCVAGVGEQFPASLLLRSIERSKVLLRHIDFAAHFENFGDIFARQMLRNIGDMRDIRGHVFADLSVPACRRAHQLSILVAQRA